MTDTTAAVAPVQERIASGRDARGRPVHRGWEACGRRRWMAPFILVLLAERPSHGYALIGQLEAMGVTEGKIDVGEIYRTLRCLEKLGHVRSSWSAEPTGPQHRDYELTDAGGAALDEWAVVMTERVRLIGEFEARYRGLGGSRRRDPGTGTRRREASSAPTPS